MSNPWLNHVAKVRSANPNLSYKECLVKAKSSYKKKQAGGNPALLALASKGADTLTSGLNFAGQIAGQVANRRDKSGFYDHEGRMRAMNTYNNLKYRRDNWGKSGAIMKKNQIPKEYSDADLKRISGLDKYL